MKFLCDILILEMTNIQSALKNKKALIPYITAGDPNLKTTEKLIFKLEEAGADVIELGIPFSDPLADGPIIQASHLRSLKRKTSLKDVFALVARVRRKTQIPLLFMLSVNLIYQFGVAEFILQAKKVGLNGILVPDLPLEEEQRKEFSAVDKSGLDVIYLIAPNTPEDRIEKICDRALGFIYLVSLTGVTGVRKALSDTVKVSVEKIKKYTGLPVCVGFGISNPDQARAAAKVADGVIVGSAIVKLLTSNGKQGVAKVLSFVKDLRKAIDAA